MKDIDFIVYGNSIQPNFNQINICKNYFVN